ncbi:hypothetical protein Tco_0792824 [Tanacetum coccineum]
MSLLTNPKAQILSCLLVRLSSPLMKKIFTTNNEVALLYPSHSNLKYFEIVSDFISKCCLNEAFTRAQTQYKEYLCEFWYTAKTLDDSKIWVFTPIGEIRGDIGYSGEIGAKGTLKKSFLPPRWRLLMGQIIQCLGGKTGGLDQISNKDATIMSLVFIPRQLKPNQTEGPPFTDHMKAICNLDVLVHSKDPKPSSQNKEVPQGKKPRARSGLKRKQSSKHTSESNTEASNSKTGQSDKETRSSSAKDKSLSHPSPPTPLVGKIHKQAQQAVGGPPVKNEPTLNSVVSASGCNTLADSTIEADPGTSAPNDFIPSQQDLLKDIRSAFFTPDSLQDEPIIVSNESEEEETGKDEDTHATSYDIPEDTSVPHHPSHNSNLRVNDLVQKKLKTLDSLPSLLNKVTKTLNRFATLVENASGATTKDVPLAGQATTSPAEGEKNINPTIKDVEPNLHDELVDLLGIDVVTQYYNKKLLYDKYYDKMMKRIKSSKITNCDVHT